MVSPSLFLHHHHHRFLPLLLLFLISIATFATIILPTYRASAQSLSEEAIALLSLKASLRDESGSLKDWEVRGDEASPCTWTGITCSEGEDNSLHVISLNLSSKNLSGYLSIAIAKLSCLKYLSVSANNLSGDFPSQILTNLTNLRVLNISNNVFNGFFPTPLGFPSSLSQHSLEVFDAFNNNFTGKLPLELSLLVNLTHLHLGGNYFSGTIPPQYGNLLNLQYLALSGNALSGRIPPQLGNLLNLQRLYLGYFNQFQGGIPVELGRLTNLVRLDLASCGLSGSIPPILGSLTRLDSLFLQTNNLVGPIPIELWNLTSLKSLDLSNNRLTGPLPIQLASLTKLELLNLFLNSLNGSIPSYIGDLPKLQVLTLWENNFSGSVPQQLGSNGELLEVDLSSNYLTGPIPPHLCKSKKLHRLVLLRNRFEGPIPTGLGLCPNLVRVRLGENLLTGSIPNSLLSLPKLDLLELSYNNLDGSFPNMIPRHDTRLGSLDLSNNKFGGTIPPTIGLFSALVDLDLSSNFIIGSIPNEVRSLKHLAKLDLSKNKMSGGIPKVIGECTSLTNLDLSHNYFEGGIPPEISHLNVLASLNLSRNLFNGTIPTSFQTMVTLTSIDFSFNNLSGMVPTQGQFANFNWTSFMGNPQLCGKQMMENCIIDAKNTSSRQSRSIIYGMGGLVVGLFILTLSAVIFVLRNDQDKKFLWSLFRANFLEKKMMKKKKKKKSWKLTAFERLDFSVTDVLQCLSNENIIGKGGSGTVYKGLMPDGKMVAIKRLPTMRKTSYTKDEEEEQLDDHGFSAEILTLGNIRHRHIVRLLGCCSNHDTNLLIYEYMINGSLGELLHGPRGCSLSWASRFRIALEAAKGLCYLHHDCSPLIVHRDVKSNNILLDSNFEAHVADFGLARPLPDSGKSESMSSVVGSYGYIAPEYAYTLKINEKSDIYSFGIVLLELLTGRRPIEPEYGDCIDIARWVRKHVHEPARVQVAGGGLSRPSSSSSSSLSLLDVLDERLGLVEGSRHIHEAVVLLKVALRCLADVPDQRPTMRDVVQLLSDSVISVDNVKDVSLPLTTEQCGSSSPTHLISI